MRSGGEGVKNRHHSIMIRGKKENTTRLRLIMKSDKQLVGICEVLSLSVDVNRLIKAAHLKARTNRHAIKTQVTVTTGEISCAN